MRLAMESHTGGMPLCGLGAPETERVGATRSHDVEVGHTMGPPSERSHAASRNAITPRRSGLTTGNRLRYPSSAEATPELFHGTRDTTVVCGHRLSDGGPGRAIRASLDGPRVGSALTRGRRRAGPPSKSGARAGGLRRTSRSSVRMTETPLFSLGCSYSKNL